MIIGNLGEIKAIAFDIDGTLYRNISFYPKVAFHFAFNFPLFRKFNSVRKEMHCLEEPVPDFMKIQAQKMAEKMGCSQEEAYMAIDRIAYGGLINYFERTKPCKGVVNFIQNCKANGLKVGILSDFPPEQKGELWGIKPFCDVILGTEECGLLKPSPHSFLLLAEKLGVKPEEILYIGNSQLYDVIGSKNAGMKSAWFVLPFFVKRKNLADITFCSYNKLNKLLFGNNTSA